MPRKGPPRCECGWHSYRIVTENPGGVSVIECRHCGRRRKTRATLRYIKIGEAREALRKAKGTPAD